MEANTSNDSGNGGKDNKRQQFTIKQRMDMYAFCVLELEMHSNKVSIKKQQQAIQKVLHEQQKEGSHRQQQQNNHHSIQQQNPPTQQQQQTPPSEQQQQQPPLPASRPSTQQELPIEEPNTNHHQLDTSLQHQQNGEICQQQQLRNEINCNHGGEVVVLGNGEMVDRGQAVATEGKTLLQLQQEVAMTRKCYSDYQKTQVLTTSMLRDVQKRFAKYYPDQAIPSRTTIKHVFEKCVAHGTVENIKTPRKATKIPQGDEIEYLLIHEPQLSLRQMAQKLNVSTGTVSRRCKALGLVPESVTIKHQQLATARRQKQIKQIKLENQSKAATMVVVTTTTTTTNTASHT